MDLPVLAAIRRHHAVEHATITVLHQRRGRIVAVAGYSDPWGYRLFGPFGPEEVQSAADEAVTRLRAGEWHLAISQFCGTNFAVTGVVAGGVALLAAGRSRRKGWPNAIVAASVATLAAARAGFWLQRHITTDPDIGSIEVREVREGRPVGSARQVRVILNARE